MVAVTHVGPSLTTYTKLNPSFRVFEVDNDTNQIVDYTQYRINLEESNKTGEAKWEVAYSFKDLYKVPDMSRDSLVQIYNKLRSGDKDTQKLYIQNHYTLWDPIDRLSES